MTSQTRHALTRLIDAFETHFALAQLGEDSDADALEAAEEQLRNAFFTYDDELFTRFGVELPFDLLDEEDDEDFDEDEEEDFDDVDEDDEDDDFIDVDD
ncbi:hypothetical protein [Schaalia vaccimaxillae]|uniref:hypothetical protein n=1 Tax=Schaalia vaccimaxillae TaxID=183916 RepID=UPI0003B61C36|nr:hypothetical protein [Schaalia vaccimaxillae]